MLNFSEYLNEQEETKSGGVSDWISKKVGQVKNWFSPKEPEPEADAEQGEEGTGETENSSYESPRTHGGGGVGSRMFASGLAQGSEGKQATPIKMHFMKNESISPETLVQRARFSLIKQTLSN
jgi:hypothetical protein